MTEHALPEMAELERLREIPAVLFSAALGTESAAMLYECLRRQGRVEQLDLVLSTVGGPITAARQIAQLVRGYADGVTILVPHHASSAGTLLSLSADTLVMGPMSHLGPADPQISSTGPPPADTPGVISSEDIRAFRAMAEDWFGVTGEDDQLQVLALLAQRVFPGSLGSFYRHDRLARDVAEELLRWQLPEASDAERRRIADQIVTGYDSHDYVISRADARALGLRVRDASDAEEDVLWRLARRLRRDGLGASDGEGDHEIGLVAGRGFLARETQRWQAPGVMPAGAEGTPVLFPAPLVRWEIEEVRDV